MKTMIVEARLGRISGAMIRPWLESLLAGGVDELALAQEKHLPADGLRHVRDVDEPDHDRRHHQRVPVQRADPAERK